jgi:hypothetical protein
MSRNADALRRFLVDCFCDIDVFIDAMRQGEVELFDADMVYEDANLPDHIGEIYRGHDRILLAAERWREGSERLRLTLDEIIGDGDDIVSVHHLHAATEGMELVGPVAYHWKFRAGRVVHLQSFRGREEALDVAGLTGLRLSDGT